MTSQMYAALLVLISDHFKIGVTVGAMLLVAGITFLRFCGSLSLPQRTAAPVASSTEPATTSAGVLSKAAASPTTYRSFLASDAKRAGLPTPTTGQMSHKLTYRSDEARHVLEIGAAPIEVAGLRLHVERTADLFVLGIENRTSSELAYEVITQPMPRSAECNSARPLPFDAMVVGKTDRELRTECKWSAGIALVVTKVETLELEPLSAFYVRHVPPSIVGIEDRIARGHRVAETGDRCSPMVPQAVREGIDRGEIGWRDLVDFYARHRCQTYQFPLSYRAFKADNEATLPVVDSPN